MFSCIHFSFFWWHRKLVGWPLVTQAPFGQLGSLLLCGRIDYSLDLVPRNSIKKFQATMVFRWSRVCKEGAFLHMLKMFPMEKQAEKGKIHRCQMQTTLSSISRQQLLGQAPERQIVLRTHRVEVWKCMMFEKAISTSIRFTRFAGCFSLQCTFDQRSEGSHS